MDPFFNMDGSGYIDWDVPELEMCECIGRSSNTMPRASARAKKPIDRSATERQIGRLLGRNSRAAARYQIRLVEDPATPAGLRLAWSMRPEWDEWSRTSEGCYVRRTNLSDWTSEDLWRTYIQLSEAEAAFRIHKSELSIRPIWHQRGTGCWRTSWCASSPTCCGRRWSNGRAAPGWATPPATSSKSSRPSREPASSCQRPRDRNASCVCAAWCVPTAPKPHSSSASAYASRNGCACRPAHAKCSAKLGPQVLENTHLHP